MRWPGSKSLSEMRLGARNSRMGELWKGVVASLVRPTHRSALVNVFHCCVQKTASQWIRNILSDSLVTRRSGLRHYHYQSRWPGGYDPRPLTERSFEQPFPPRTIVSPLYISYEAYRTIPKRNPTRAFFVMRDPRDIVISSYYSMRYSHGPRGEVKEIRDLLAGLPESEGMCRVIDRLDDIGVFEALRSWLVRAHGDPMVKLVRFEDLIGEQQLEHFVELFSWCDIQLCRSEVTRVLDRYSFERLAGRHAGIEDPRAHYRKGVSGDWKEHFDGGVNDYFECVTGDLVGVLAY